MIKEESCNEEIQALLKESELEAATTDVRYPADEVHKNMMNLINDMTRVRHV